MWGEHLTDVGPQQVFLSHGNYYSLLRVFLLASFHYLLSIAGVLSSHLAQHYSVKEGGIEFLGLLYAYNAHTML